MKKIEKNKIKKMRFLLKAYISQDKNLCPEIKRMTREKISKANSKEIVSMFAIMKVGRREGKKETFRGLASLFF